MDTRIQGISCKKQYPDAIVPEKGSIGAAGFDLYAYLGIKMIHLQPGERVMINTGISISFPFSWYGRIAPRSGLALKNGIDVLAGVVDSDFTGEVKVILLNTGNEVFTISHGDRIAQIIPTFCGYFQRMVVVDNLNETERGEGGFGSTGKN